MLEKAIDGRNFAKQIAGLLWHEEIQVCTRQEQFQHGNVRPRFDECGFPN
jgi:hypothetical protein